MTNHAIRWTLPLPTSLILLFLAPAALCAAAGPSHRPGVAAPSQLAPRPATGRPAPDAAPLRTFGEVLMAPGGLTSFDNLRQLATLGIASLNGARFAAAPSGGLGARTAPIPVIAATKVDAFPNHSNGGKAVPGDTINYTVVITNSGTGDANNVSFSDTLDTDTTLVPGSVFTTPIAVPDSYSALGNVGLSISAGSGLLANDEDPDGVGPALTASAGTTSTQGGNVSVSSDGSFTYNPPAGFEGTDTFTYTLHDNDSDSGGHTDTATVTITVTGMIWFINRNATSNGDGRLSSPFQDASNFQAVNDGAGNHPAANDNIFLYESATSYAGSITLLNGQKLIGQDATASLASIAGVTVPGGSVSLPAMNTGAPATTLTTTVAATNAVNLGTGNTIRGLTVGNTTGTDINGGAVGTLTVSEVTLSGTGQAFVVSTSGVLNVTLDSLSSSSGTNGVSLTGCSGTFTANAGSISGPTGDDFVVSGGTVTVSYAGSITNTTGHSVNVSGKTTSGDVSFSGAISDIGTGISLTSNGGTTTINFSGGLTLNTGANTAFTATGGGTVTATQNNTSIINTATTTTATALNIANTTIGASGLTFRSITAGTAASGPVNGIVLNTTGASSGLTVTGTGTTAGSGGTIQKTTGDGIHIVSAANISLSNMNLTNSAQTQTVTANNDLTLASLAQNVANLYLSSVSNVSLTNLSVSGSTQQGILALSVAGLTLANSTISGNGNQDYEDGLLFKNLTGTVSISNTNVQNNFSRQAHGRNDAGTLTLNVTGSFFGRAAAPAFDPTPGEHSQQGLLLELAGTSTSAVDVGTSSFVKNGNGNGLQINLSDTATLGSSGTHSSLHNSTTLSENAAHVFVNTTSGAVGFFDVMNNAVMTKAGLQAIDYFVNPASNSSAGLTGVIQGNTIGTSGVAGSGSNRSFTGGGADGMTIDRDGAGILNLRIQSNTVQQVETNGIALTTSDSGTSAASITGNTFREPGNQDPGANSQGNALLFNVGAASTSTTHAYYTITGNTIADTAAKTWDINGSGATIYFNTKNATVTNLPGYAGGSTNDTNFQNFVNGNNTFNLTGFGGTIKTLATRFNGSTYGVASSPLPAPLLFAPSPTDFVETPAADGGSAPALIVPPELVAPVTTSAGGAVTPVDDRGSPTGALTVSHPPAPVDDGILTQNELDALVKEGVARWEATGLSPAQSAALRQMKFEVRDLAGWYLGEADSGRITLDSNAGGHQWFIDATPRDDAEFAGSTTQLAAALNGAAAGRVDALTAVMHEMGHVLGLPDNYDKTARDSVMYGFLTLNERRLPTTGEAIGATPNLHPHGADFLFAPLTIGTLPAGKSITITFQATVNNLPNLDSTHLSGGAHVSNQGTVSGTNFSTVQTDDTAVGGTSDPTVTPLDLFHSTTTLGSDHNPSVLGQTVTFSAAVAFDTAQVSPTPATPTTPTGTVQFFDGASPITCSNGNTSTQTLDGSGDASCSISTLTATTHSITGHYSGDGNYDVSTSNTVSQVVQADNTPPTVTGVPNDGSAADIDVQNSTTTLEANWAGVFADPESGVSSYAWKVGTTLGGAELFDFTATGIIGGATGTSASRGSLSLTPGATYYVTVRATNGVALTSTATSDGVHINRAPSATTNTGLTVLEGGSGTIVNTRLASSDPDSDTFTYTVGAAPTHGTLRNNGVALAPNDTFTQGDIDGNKLTYQHDGSETTGDSFTFTLTDSNGLAGTLQTFGLTITPVNDAPSGANHTASLNEDQSYALAVADFGFSDGDNPPNNLKAVEITTLPNAGSLTDNGVAVTTGQFVQVADISGGLLVFTPAPDANGTGYASFTFQVRDDGGTSNGGVDTDPTPRTFAFNVAAVNDPVHTAGPGAASILEDTTTVLSTAGGTALSISDVDATLAPNGVYEVTLSGTHGTLTLTTLTGLAFTAGDGTADSTMTCHGTLSDLNTALATATYTPDANYTGSAKVSISATDSYLGVVATGTGAATTDGLDVNLTVTAVNDAPTTSNNTVATAEDATYAFQTADFPFADSADDPHPNVLLNIIVTSLPAAGTLAYNGTALTAGDVVGGFAVTAADVTAGKLTYRPAPDANGTGYASFTFQVQDDGGTSNGGADTSAGATMTIDVSAVNDPVHTAGPGAASLNEDTPTAISGLAISDVDATLAPNGVYEVTLSCTHGTLTLTTLTGLAFTAGGGTADISMTFHGTLADLNTALATTTYTPDANYNGLAKVSISATDIYNGVVATGTGAPTTDSQDVNLLVTAANDPVTASAPGAVTLNEDTPTAISGLAIADVDATLAPNGVYEVTLSATHGTLTLTTLTGLTFTAGDGTEDASMTFHGTLSDLNTALATVSYAAAADYNGSAQVSLGVTDQFGGIVATGSGAATSDSKNIVVTVTSVNDAPRGSDNTVSLYQDGHYTFSAADFGFSDGHDSPANHLLAVEITTPPSAGTLTDNVTAVTAGQFVSVADVNSGLLVFTPAAGATGSPYSSFTFQVQDDGGTANGGQSTDPTPRTMTINVNADPVPTVTLDKPAPGYGRTLNPVGGTASDVGSGVAGVTLSIQRQSDNQFWDGSGFNSPSAVQLATSYAGGNWSKSTSLPALAQLPDGSSYTLIATATDLNGHAGSTAPVTVTIDKGLPSVAITAPGGGGFLTSFPPVSGTASDGVSGIRTVWLSIQQGSGNYWNGTGFSSASRVLLATSYSGGTWSKTTGLPGVAKLSDGPYTLQAEAVDNVSNGQNSATLTFTIDRTPPTVGITAPANGTFIKSLPTITGTANDGSGSGVATVTFTLRQVSTGRYWNGSAFIGATPATAAQLATDNAATWSSTVPLPTPATGLTDGDYLITARATDQLGGAATASATVHVDSSGPVASFDAPLTDGAAITALSSISGSVTDTVGGVTGAGVDHVTLYLQRLSDGSGWTGSGWGALTALTAVAPGTPTQTTTFGLNTSTSPRLPNASELSDGDYQIIVNSYDVLGNSRGQQVTVHLDTHTPTVSINATAGQIRPGLTQLSGAANDTNGKVSGKVVSVAVTLTDGGGNTWDGTAFTAGSHSVLATLSPAGGASFVTWSLAGPAQGSLPDGGYTIAATATDWAGHSASTTVGVVIDGTAPSVSIANPVNNSTISTVPTFSGSANENGSGTVSGLVKVEVTFAQVAGGGTSFTYWDGTGFSSAAPVYLAATLNPVNPPANTSAVGWSLSVPNASIPNGRYRVMARATDRAGNGSSIGAYFTKAPATPAPVAPTASFSSGSASASNGQVKLSFNGTLSAASADDAANYSVTVNGVSLAVTAATLDAGGGVVTLQLAALQAGDSVTVAYHLQDGKGNAVSGTTGAIRVR